MEYRPRYAQPFTLSEAVLLDPGTISEEIGRLENSLQHLRETQEQLRQHLAGPETDPDLQEAFEENETVIGSQKERITILKTALVQKGVIQSSAHYDLPQPGQVQRQVQPGTASVAPDEPMQEEGGIIL